MKIKNIVILVMIFSTLSLSKTIHYKLDAETRTGQRIIQQEIKYRNHLKKTIIKEIKENREDINRLNEAISILIEKEIKRNKSKSKNKEKKETLIKRRKK